MDTDFTSVFYVHFTAILWQFLEHFDAYLHGYKNNIRLALPCDTNGDKALHMHKKWLIHMFNIRFYELLQALLNKDQSGLKKEVSFYTQPKNQCKRKQEGKNAYKGHRFSIVPRWIVTFGLEV